MKKRLCAAVMAVMMTVSFTGCSSEPIMETSLTNNSDGTTTTVGDAVSLGKEGLEILYETVGKVIAETVSDDIKGLAKSEEQDEEIEEGEELTNVDMEQ